MLCGDTDGLGAHCKLLNDQRFRELILEISALESCPAWAFIFDGLRK